MTHQPVWRGVAALMAVFAAGILFGGWADRTTIARNQEAIQQVHQAVATFQAQATDWKAQETDRQEGIEAMNLQLTEIQEMVGQMAQETIGQMTQIVTILRTVLSPEQQIRFDLERRLRAVEQR